ncbi:hypothetical protein [Polyangium aurulentum]|uniref:hypothetical protein n=1 Tax=Polyangium aurulentum TaxID=2567896 RepID=UPI0010AE6203|nr:hypothetical protein [Polyangium aurulentum]UQA60543.1 hypothetical protein E8A73_008745 [Polyangium aurulentum]
MPTHVVVLGKQTGPQEVELLGAGIPSYIVPATRITAGVRRLIDEGHGGKVLAEVQPGKRHGVACNVATLVRELEPTPEDVERLRTELARFRRAGVEGFPTDSDVHVREVLASLVAEGAPFWDPHAHLVERFLRDQVCFPSMWWHDDPEVGVDEMVELLERVARVRRAFPKRKILAAARKDLDRPDTDEEEARERLCVMLCAAANAALEKGHSERFCGPFQIGSEADEPNWIFCRPERFEALLREGILSPWTSRGAQEPHVYKRPPDRGEIDFDNFPSGDDPF